MATPTNLFEFDQFRVRQATEDDRALVEQWIAADPDHVGRVRPDFFLREERGVGCYLLSDEEGPLFFFRTANTVRLDIQFGPSDSADERRRNREGMVEGMDWLAKLCAAKGASEIIFASEAPMLTRLAVQRMGCCRSRHELVRDLTTERLGLSFLGNWQGTPQPSGKGGE